MRFVAMLDDPKIRTKNLEKRMQEELLIVVAVL